MSSNKENQNNQIGFIQRFLKTVEWIGNVLPDPVTLFFLFCIAIILLSGFFEWIGLSVVDPRPEGVKGRAADGMINVVSLLSADGLRRIVSGTVSNFTNFAPLGTVLVAMLGVGISTKSGLLRTFIRQLVLRAPHSILPFVVVFAGVVSNLAADVGYVVLVPLAGFVFMAVGRHPIAGMAAGFAGVSGGYSANLVIGTIDPILAGITQEAARLIDQDYVVNVAANWYFMLASTFVITIVGGLITSKIVEPNLGKYDSSESDGSITEEDTTLKDLTDVEREGLKWAAITTIIMGIIAALTIVPEWGILRDPETGSALRSPFFSGMVFFIFIFFAIPSIVYGKIVGTIKTDKDIIDGMSSSMKELSLYIVLVFFAAQFVAYFKWTNLGSISAVIGADFLKSIGLTGAGIFIPFILICGLVNFALGSASAQWAVTAPIFVPMLMLVGYSPEVIQAAYRIGDSSTNIITPMMSYFGLILAFAMRFKKDIKVGTIVSTMLPYSMLFMLSWTVLLYIWVFVLGLPTGPGAPIYYTP